MFPLSLDFLESAHMSQSHNLLKYKEFVNEIEDEKGREGVYEGDI